MGEILESFSVHGERVRDRVDGGGSATCFGKFYPKGFWRFRGIRFDEVFERWGYEGEAYGETNADPSVCVLENFLPLAPLVSFSFTRINTPYFNFTLAKNSLPHHTRVHSAPHHSAIHTHSLSYLVFICVSLRLVVGLDRNSSTSASASSLNATYKLDDFFPSTSDMICSS